MNMEDRFSELETRIADLEETVRKLATTAPPAFPRRRGKNSHAAPAPAAAGGEEAANEGRPAKRKHKEGPKFLTPDQIDAVRAAIAKSDVSEKQRARDTAIFEVGFGRGLRASEVGKLERSDVRNERGAWIIRVKRVKGSRGGEYRANDREVRALRAWLRERGDAPGALFPSRNRRAIGVSAIDDLIRGWAAAAGIPPELRHFHVLRHSCGVRLAELDVPIEEAQDHLGHVSITNTQIYYQISNRRRRERDARLKDRW